MNYKGGLSWAGTDKECRLEAQALEDGVTRKGQEGLRAREDTGRGHFVAVMKDWNSRSEELPVGLYFVFIRLFVLGFMFCFVKSGESLKGSISESRKGRSIL